MIKIVVDSGYTGFYLRVVQEGTVLRGVEMTLTERDPLMVSVSYASRIYHHERKNREAIEKVLAVAALSTSWQKSFQELRASCG